MPLTFEKAPPDVLELIAQVMQEHHPALAVCEVRVDALLTVTGELKHHGWPAAATIRVVPLPQRVLGLGDALMTIEGAGWDRLGEASRIALVDHELEHLRVLAKKPHQTVAVVDGETVGEPKVDDIGRPRLRLKAHDFEIAGFRSIVERHGADAIEVRNVEACRDDTGQFLWDWKTKKRSL